MNNQVDAPQTADASSQAQMSAPAINESKLQDFIARLRTEQRLMMGVFGGLGAALVGAAVWTVVTVLTHFQIGWMAVGVGFLVGMAIRQFGKGIDKIFGVIGASLALVGCVLGNLFSGCEFLAEDQKVSFFDVVGVLTPQLAADILAVTFHPMDLLFYGIAIYEGYKFSFRTITRDELMREAT